MTRVAIQSRARPTRFGMGGGVGADVSDVHSVPIPKRHAIGAPFGGPARSGSAVALRTRLATGVPFRGSRATEWGRVGARSNLPWPGADTPSPKRRTGALTKYSSTPRPNGPDPHERCSGAPVRGTDRAPIRSVRAPTASGERPLRLARRRPPSEEVADAVGQRHRRRPAQASQPGGRFGGVPDIARPGGPVDATQRHPGARSTRDASVSTETARPDATFQVPLGPPDRRAARAPRPRRGRG